MTRILSAILLTATLAAPAFAQDTLPPAPTEATPQLRIAPQVLPKFDDTIIELGAVETIAAPTTIITDARIFSRFDGAAPLSRMDRAEIEAEIAARFGKTKPVSTAQTGLVFEPDLTMVFKPLEAAGRLRDDL